MPSICFNETPQHHLIILTVGKEGSSWFDDPTGQLEAAWGIKEHLRILLHSTSLERSQHHRMVLGAHVISANIPEMTTLWDTINAWWTEIEVLLVTGVTNARTKAANTTIKHIKRTGRGVCPRFG